MRLREAMARTMAHGDLRQSPLEETGADRMAALGLSDSLGSAMWRVTADHDGPSLIAAATLLAKRVQKGRESLTFLRKLCAAVINEWLDDKCRKCGGRGYIMVEDRVKDACKVCRGEALRRHSDSERCRVLGIERSSYKKWEGRFAEAHALLADAVLRVQRQCAMQLERGRPV